MRAPTVNSLSFKAVFVLSLLAAGTVAAGFFTAPQPDEGALAHIFQLSIAAIAAMLLLFLLTDEWKRPLRTVARLALPGAVLASALVALYFLEHR